eukprot:804886-Prymnesium_polylepis.2
MSVTSYAGEREPVRVGIPEVLQRRGPRARLVCPGQGASVMGSDRRALCVVRAHVYRVASQATLAGRLQRSSSLHSQSLARSHFQRRALV